MNPESEIQALEELIDQILKGLQDTIMSGEILSDEFQGMIAQELEVTLSRIDELKQMTGQETPELEEAEQEQAQVANEMAPPEPPTPPTGGPVPPLDQAPHPSSNINAFRYDPKTGKLFVKFMGKNTKDSGPIYSYEGVPPYIFDVFRRGAVGPKTSGRNRWHRWEKGKTPSHGAAMSALIKSGAFPYQRVR